MDVHTVLPLHTGRVTPLHDSDSHVPVLHPLVPLSLVSLHQTAPCPFSHRFGAMQPPTILVSPGNRQQAAFESSQPPGPMHVSMQPEVPFGWHVGRPPVSRSMQQMSPGAASLQSAVVAQIPPSSVPPELPVELVLLADPVPLPSFEGPASGVPVELELLLLLLPSFAEPASPAPTN
jgi:hypothetical protein